MAELRSIATGYMRAHKRLREAYSKAYALFPDTEIDEQTAEEIWIELFETMNWLDALRLHPRGQAEMDRDFRDALRFVRGRVHHVFADAIEFRRDVLLHLSPIRSGGGPVGPLPIADWCWRRAVELPGGSRSSSARSQQQSGQTAYGTLLQGKQVSAALDLVPSLAAALFTESLSQAVTP